MLERASTRPDGVQLSILPLAGHHTGVGQSTDPPSGRLIRRRGDASAVGEDAAGAPGRRRARSCNGNPIRWAILSHQKRARFEKIRIILLYMLFTASDDAQITDHRAPERPPGAHDGPRLRLNGPATRHARSRKRTWAPPTPPRTSRRSSTSSAKPGEARGAIIGSSERRGPRGGPPAPDHGADSLRGSQGRGEVE